MSGSYKSRQVRKRERVCVVEPDSPQKEVPVRDSEQGTDSVHGAEGLLSENSDGASSTSDFETPRRLQLGESPCEMGFRAVRAEDPVFVPDTPGMRNMGELRGSNTPFLTSAAQLGKLMASINDTSQCKSEGCEGKLRLKSVELLDMGGDATAHFTCSGGCGTRNVCLPCSEPYKDSQQSVLSVSLQIAFICSGANYAQYERVLGSLGMHPVSDHRFYETIQLLLKHLTGRLFA